MLGEEWFVVVWVSMVGLGVGMVGVCLGCVR